MEILYGKWFTMKVQLQIKGESGGGSELKKHGHVRTKKEVLPEVGRLLIEMIDIVARRDPNHGYSLRSSVPEITELAWTCYNTNYKIFQSGKYAELKEDDPPVSLMTPLPVDVDRALQEYHRQKVLT